MFVCVLCERGREVRRERRGRQVRKQSERERGMQSVGQRGGQQFISLLFTICPAALHLSVHLSISPLSVRPLSCLLRCWFMTDPGEDAEVPCGQESQVGGGRKE